MGIEYVHIEYGWFWLLLFMLKIETSTRGTNSMPFLILRRGSFVVHIGDHLRFGIISGLGIICGRGSFAALYISPQITTPHFFKFAYLVIPMEVSFLSTHTSKFLKPTAVCSLNMTCFFTSLQKTLTNAARRWFSFRKRSMPLFATKPFRIHGAISALV